MNWNLSDFLLPDIKETFDEVIATYTNLLWSYIKTEIISKPLVVENDDDQCRTDVVLSDTNKSIECFAKELISNKMSLELFG